MLVYRVCSKEEIDLILNKGIKEAGKIPEITDYNSHNYKLGIPYMHFFFYKRDILHIVSNREYHICTYDIPRELLDPYCGVGKYMDYISFKSRVYVVEFAIPAFELKNEYLRRIDVLTDYIDFEDFLGSDIDSNKYETIYDASKPIIRERKKEGSPS